MSKISPCYADPQGPHWRREGDIVRVAGGGSEVIKVNFAFSIIAPKNVYSSSYISRSGPFEHVVLFLSLIFLLYRIPVIRQVVIWSTDIIFGNSLFFSIWVHVGPGHHKMFRKMCCTAGSELNRVKWQCFCNGTWITPGGLWRLGTLNKMHEMPSQRFKFQGRLPMRSKKVCGNGPPDYHRFSKKKGNVLGKLRPINSRYEFKLIM